MFITKVSAILFCVFKPFSVEDALELYPIVGGRALIWLNADSRLLLSSVIKVVSLTDPDD